MSRPPAGWDRDGDGFKRAAGAFRCRLSPTGNADPALAWLLVVELPGRGEVQRSVGRRRSLVRWVGDLGRQLVEDLADG